MKYVRLLNNGLFTAVDPIVGQLIPENLVKIDSLTGLAKISADNLIMLGCKEASGSDYPFTKREYEIVDVNAAIKDIPKLTMNQFVELLRNFDNNSVSCAGISCTDCPLGLTACRKLVAFSKEV